MPSTGERPAQGPSPVPAGVAGPDVPSVPDLEDDHGQGPESESESEWADKWRLRAPAYSSFF